MDKSIELKIFGNALQQTSDAVVITDVKGIIQYVNPAFEKISGFSKEEAIGNTPRIIKSGKHNNIFYKKLWKTILSGNVFRGLFVNKAKSGRLFFVDHTITAIKNDNGKIVNFIGMWKDITERKLAEEKKDEFISIASHELKTPLTTIKAYADILSQSLNNVKNTDVNEYLSKMNNEIERLMHLVNDLLDVSKIQTKKMELVMEKFNFDTLLKEIVENIKLISSREIANVGNLNIEICADKFRIEQVVTNLVINAIKYSDDKSKIVITKKIENGQLIVGVQDFGVGISSKDINKIFNRYYRSNNLKGKFHHSIGLGLYIASEIIKKHKGKIWVESVEKKGSTFYFSLPIIN